MKLLMNSKRSAYQALCLKGCYKPANWVRFVASLSWIVYLQGSYSERGSDLAYSVRANVSAYRVSMIIVTCLCILVVDFTIYPRRYAKTETYCTGLICTLPRSGAADMYSNCKQRIYTRICKKCDRYVLRFVSSAAYMYSNLLAYMHSNL
ncbi:GPI-anchored wall transfer protein 1-like isoform X2 [Papaver somniferum]|uniref:GPI-anchored wall transfer protein 1-like isoform X2 n=1 Tax=Papaver somniferum TaxID=3469 RepID=UPI000E6FBD9E|nr:GPI-anchored wall transfer protein 1-like isoform X2 [Papaver somniferum]